LHSAATAIPSSIGPAESASSDAVSSAAAMPLPDTSETMMKSSLSPRSATW